MKIHLETERLYMRDIEESDLEDLFELDSDPEVHKYLGNNPVKDRAKTQKIIKDIHQQYKDNGIGRWAVITKDNNEFTGWSALKYETYPINNKNGYYDIGYRFKKKYWGLGYATETASAAINYGFSVLKLDQICGAAQIENIGSNKVLKKIGLKFIEQFYYEDTKCNWYEINRKDWEELQRQ